MALHKVKRGLDLPISGAPEQRISKSPLVSAVALVAADYVGMKPTMFVRPGDTVKRGQALFEDKKNPGVLYTSPGAGTVRAVNRGDKRALQSVVVDLSDSERTTGQPGPDEEATFENFADRDPAGLSREEIKALLIESGMWPSIRQRPYGRTPAIDDEPEAMFITAMDTNPHAPDPDVVIKGAEEDFARGCIVVAKLTEGSTYVCRAPGSAVPVNPNTGLRVEEFQGPHPAGNVGLHMHVLNPVNREHVAWHINYQEVIAIGRLFATGKLDVRRVISIAGPQALNPRLVPTRFGASTLELTDSEMREGENRIISGSVIGGRTASDDVHGFLGRHHHQISVLAEGREREFMGWLSPGPNKFSTIPIYVSRLLGGQKFDFTTTTNGSHRAMVPIGMYERVFPFDMEPAFLLRELIVGNLERSEQLGALELDEEDIALCTFVCPAKYEYGPILRDALTQIEKEG